MYQDWISLLSNSYDRDLHLRSGQMAKYHRLISEKLPDSIHGHFSTNLLINRMDDATPSNTINDVLIVGTI